MPAMLLGALLTAVGLVLFLENGQTPTGAFPDGAASGPEFLGFETNGWTAWFTTCAGAILLFGASQHLLARFTSLLVGLALGACAVMGAYDGDVLGLAATNYPIDILWGAFALLLLVPTLAPRLGRMRTRRRERRKAVAIAEHEKEQRDRPRIAPPPPAPNRQPTSGGVRLSRS